MAENTFAPPIGDKPVIVRVKRKVFQSPLDAFWLEIQERPLKRPLIDFAKLSISDASSSRVDELKSKKILVQHLETVTSSEDTFEVLQSFVPNPSDELNSKDSNQEGRRNVRTVNKQDQLLGKAKQRQEVLSRNARFEQIWRSRKAKIDAPEDEAIYDMCQLYDVVRVDNQNDEVQAQKQKEKELEDCRMMAQYLPLLREVLPSAAAKIESDIHACESNQASSDGYVYDFYAVKEDSDVMEVDSSKILPLIQVEEDFYEGPDYDSEYESDDSNAENNPLNDYPEEETSEEEDECKSRSSDENSEDESTTSGSKSEELVDGNQVFFKYKGSGSYENGFDEDLGPYDWSDNENECFDDELYSDEDD